MLIRFSLIHKKAGPNGPASQKLSDRVVEFAGVVGFLESYKYYCQLVDLGQVEQALVGFHAEEYRYPETVA